METKSIEERAYDLHKKVEQRLCSLFDSGSTSIFKIHANVVDLIQEQDRIARNEERERCINIIKSVICASCINNKHIDICSVTLCRAKELINAIERR